MTWTSQDKALLKSVKELAEKEGMQYYDIDPYAVAIECKGHRLRISCAPSSPSKRLWRLRYKSPKGNAGEIVGSSGRLRETVSNFIWYQKCRKKQRREIALPWKELRLCYRVAESFTVNSILGPPVVLEYILDYWLGWIEYRKGTAAPWVLVFPRKDAQRWKSLRFRTANALFSRFTKELNEYEHER